MTSIQFVVREPTVAAMEVMILKEGRMISKQPGAAGQKR